MSTAEELTEVAGRLDATRDHRDALVRRRSKEGATLRQIADEARLSHAGVRRILDRG